MSQAERPSISAVQPPWKESAKGYVYCRWANLPEEIKAMITQEARFESTVGQFHYYIRKIQDGSFVVFRRTKEENEAKHKQYFFKKPFYRIVELLVLPIQEANTLIATNKEYDVMGNDPVKVLNGQFYVIVGKRQRE